jgi:hypothetical protein
MRSLLLKVLAGLATLAFAPALLAAGVLAQTPVSLQPGGINVPEHPRRPVVIELFSSQGCGNCPQANANVATLAKRSDVIAMTYPVGIWDYLGWSDTLAKPEFAERQKDYNHSLGYRGPYTPQIVFSGRLHSSGANMKTIENGFAKRPLELYPLTVVFDGDKVTITGDYAGKATVNLVEFRPGMTTVKPGAGVNRGKAMQYFNVVTGVRTIGEWSGGVSTFPAKCAAGCTVLVQKDGPTGNVIGVAQKK